MDIGPELRMTASNQTYPKPLDVQLAETGAELAGITREWLILKKALEWIDDTAGNALRAEGRLAQAHLESIQRTAREALASLTHSDNEV